jgi:hypothetical protein
VLWRLPGSCSLPLAGLAPLQVHSQISSAGSRRGWLQSQQGCLQDTRGAPLAPVTSSTSAERRSRAPNWGSG